MDKIVSEKDVYNLIAENNSELSSERQEAVIILAAGHGKRIKSKVSKMLHKIWGKPTVLRVYHSCLKGFNGINVVLVVGIKAEEVINAVGKNKNLSYAYQENQLGTGHAVQVGLEPLLKNEFKGIIYIIPGDMGLLDPETLLELKKSFADSKCDMMVLTGIFEGKSEDNYYGRIIRVPEKDISGKPSGEDFGKVLQILEHKDILKLSEAKDRTFEFNGKKYKFSKNELLDINEFNAGVYAFNSEALTRHINNLKNNNVQKEIYITDLIEIFNRNNLSVGAISPKDNTVVMGFNNKSVLKEMETIAREKVYNKIKDVIFIDVPEDFFICEDCVDEILELDNQGVPLDIFLGKGVFIGRGVKLNYGTEIQKNTYLNGNIILGKNVKISENVHLSTYPNQQMIIGDNVEILWGDIIKGNITIGKGSRIESSVNMTGSDDFPVVIGKNVLIKGTSYIFGSTIEDDVFIEHSILIKKNIERSQKKDGTIRPVRFFIPMPEGTDLISDIKKESTK